MEAVVDLWTRAGLTRPWNDPRADIRHKQSQQPELFLVAEADDEVVGVIMAGDDGHRGWVHYLAVDPQQQGIGVGRALLGRVEAELTARGCPKVQLQVRLDNTNVIDLYRHLGYEPYEVVSLGKRLDG